jgi:hypothetical protein
MRKQRQILVRVRVSSYLRNRSPTPEKTATHRGNETPISKDGERWRRNRMGDELTWSPKGERKRTKEGKGEERISGNSGSQGETVRWRSAGEVTGVGDDGGRGPSESTSRSEAVSERVRAADLGF